MSVLRTVKFVCAECSADTCQTSVEAIVDANTRRVAEERVHDRSGWYYCPACDHDVEVRVVPLTELERERERAQWRRRAEAAVEAMVVRAMDVLDVELARHIVANAVTPYVLAPDVTLLPLGEALRGVVERTSPNRIESSAGLQMLLVELELIWERAHRGEDVSLGILAELRALADSGGISEAGRARAREQGRIGMRSDVSLEMLFERGIWSVKVCSPCGAWYSEQPGARSGPSGRVIARGEHQMLEVAAKLCRRALLGDQA